MAALLELLIDVFRDRGFDAERVERSGVRPERAEEMAGLDARAFEGGVEVGIPGVPEFDDAENGLEDGLILICLLYTSPSPRD